MPRLQWERTLLVHSFSPSRNTLVICVNKILFKLSIIYSQLSIFEIQVFEDGAEVQYPPELPTAAPLLMLASFSDLT